MRFARLSVFISAFALAVLSPGAALAQSALAGNVGLLNGQAQATSQNGPAHALAKGDSIYGGDIVETGPSSYAMIRFTDQGSVLLRPNSKFQV